MVFPLANFVNETVKQLYKLAIFLISAWNMNRWLDLWPRSEGFFHLRI